MTAMDHEVCKPGRTYELRMENNNGSSRTIVSGLDYKNIKIVGGRLAGKLKKDESLVITTTDGYELCRWI